MLAPRTETILKFIVENYISRAIPISSHQIADDANLNVSSATVRNEMVILEQEGYIIRPHTSAGSVPSDEGYRYYVDSLRNLNLPAAKQRLLNHVFHQVEREVEEWLSLAATLLAQTTRSVAIVTTPKPIDCKYKHIELVALQDSLALVVLVLQGAKVKQKLINFDHIVHQSALTAISNKLNDNFSGLSRKGIKSRGIILSSIEQQVLDCLLEMMQAEDEREYAKPYLDGLHFILSQPEFTQSDHVRRLMELLEYRSLLKTIIPDDLGKHAVRVIIGKENKAEAMHRCSVVVSQYGLPAEAIGTVGVVGPTRMAYENAISSVYYLSLVLSEMIAELYGKEKTQESN